MPPLFSLYQSIRLDGLGHSIGGAIADRLYCHRRAREGLIDYRECLAIALNRIETGPVTVAEGMTEGVTGGPANGEKSGTIILASTGASAPARDYYNEILRR
jgi:hypothetical protein